MKLNVREGSRTMKRNERGAIQEINSREKSRTLRMCEGGGGEGGRGNGSEKVKCEGWG